MQIPFRQFRVFCKEEDRNGLSHVHQQKQIEHEWIRQIICKLFCKKMCA